MIHPIFYRLIARFLSLLTLVGLSPAAFADTGAPLPDTTYTLITRLPGVPATGVTFEQYAPAVFKIAVAIAVILAVVMITLGGVEYVSSGASEELRTKAKGHITDALVGLILIAAIWLILGVINKNFINIPFSIPPAPTATAGAAAGTTGAVGTTSPPTITGQVWPDDSQWRNQLASSPNPINVVGTQTSGNCTTVGQKGCTSVYQLGQSAIDGTKRVAADCGCIITITGGTEYWNHTENTAHQPGNSVVDIHETQQLDQYLGVTSPTNGKTVSKDGGTFHYETFGANSANNGAHWHVVF